MYDTPKLKNACGVICRPSVSTVSKDAGIKPKTVATSALAVKSSNHLARSHPQKNIKMKIYLICSVADPDPGSGIGCFLTPGFGIRDGRKSASGSGIRDEQPRSYFLELRNHFFLLFWVLKYLNSLMRIRDGDSSDPGSGMEKSRIRDKHPGSATLLTWWINEKIYRSKIKHRHFRLESRL